jgi:hypothetical protein
MIYLLFAFYLIGGLGVLLKRAYKSAKDPDKPWTNVYGYCAVHAPDILLNFAVSTALFLSVWRDTSFITKGFHMLGIQQDIVVPLNYVTAVIFGATSDPIADGLISAGAFLVNKVRVLLPGGGTNDSQNP